MNKRQTVIFILSIVGLCIATKCSTDNIYAPVNPCGCNTSTTTSITTESTTTSKITNETTTLIFEEDKESCINTDVETSTEIPTETFIEVSTETPIETPIESCSEICSESYSEATEQGREYVKHFSRGTYYSYGYECYGGSGRYLIDCSYGTDVKGSIASSYLYNVYGYNYNGSRTKVYLEINGYPEASGYYFLDDCDAGNPEVIDFYYIYSSNCPFRYQGVVGVDCWIVK